MMRVFLKHFIIVFFGSFVLYFIIEFIITAQIKVFDIFTNFQELFKFIFFVSSSWSLISLYKTGELIAIQTSRISPFKISLIFAFFTTLFSLFYLFIYNGLILKSVALMVSFNNSALNHFSVYNKFDECNYDLIMLDNVIFKEKEDSFDFLQGDFASFRKCKLHLYKTLQKDTIKQINSTLEFKQNKISTEYNYDLFKKTFKEKVKKKSFKTFYEKLKLLFEFSKNDIQDSKLLLEIFLTIENVISFFCMTLFPFLFFIKLPPRSTMILKFFISISLVAVVHMFSLIFNSWILQTDFANPVLVLIIPSLFLCFIYLSMILQKL